MKFHVDIGVQKKFEIFFRDDFFLKESFLEISELSEKQLKNLKIL